MADRPAAGGFDAEVGAFLAHLGPVGPGLLLDHGARCCEHARTWFEAAALARPPSQAQSLSSLTWIPGRWAWGPSAWPLHWCGLVELGHLDCVALATLSRYACQLHGIPNMTVHLVERAAASAVDNWRASWRRAGQPHAWARGVLAYHQVVGLVDGAQLRLWDPTEVRERSPGERGEGRPVAVQASGPRDASWWWEDCHVASQTWQPVSSTRPALAPSWPA